MYQIPYHRHMDHEWYKGYVKRQTLRIDSHEAMRRTQIRRKRNTLQTISSVQGVCSPLLPTALPPSPPSPIATPLRELDRLVEGCWPRVGEDRLGLGDAVRERELETLGDELPDVGALDVGRLLNLDDLEDLKKQLVFVYASMLILVYVRGSTGSGHGAWRPYPGRER